MSKVNKKKALIVYGGWDGHDPVQISNEYKKILLEENFEVEMSDTLDVFKDREKLMGMDLIVPHWTMGTITSEQLEPVLSAVTGGVGLAGCHGGMCDAFHDSIDWQFMTGGQWVSHPGGQAVRYKVNIVDRINPITEGVEDFYTVSEQYYMHVDPAVRVLATTRFPAGREPYHAQTYAFLEPSSGFGTWNFTAESGDNGPHVNNGMVDMPVIWTKTFGAGRVFYNSLGHTAANFMEEPSHSMMRRGLIWAAR